MSETEESDLIHRRGQFKVSLDLMQNMPETVLQVMDGVLVVRCELRWEDRVFCYGALSQHFEPIEPGEEAPSYDVTWDEETATATWSRAEEG